MTNDMNTTNPQTTTAPAIGYIPCCTQPFRHGSLFSGIGGFDLAAQWMGWDNVFHCEWNDFGQRVLKHYWPNAESFGDITKTDFTKYHGTIDIISGGFPCQPYSAAGKRLGKEDDRHLWPEMLRAIREISPRYVVGENVRGLTNWNGGMVFDEVQADLEAEGYQVTPFLLPACAVGAPHRRDRVWFVAYRDQCTTRSSGKSSKTERNGCNNNDEPCSRRKQAKQHNRCSDVLRTTTNPGSQQFQERTPERNTQDTEKERTGMDNRTERPGYVGNVADATGKRHEPLNQNRTAEFPTPREKALYGRSGNRNDQPGTWANFPTQSPICSRNDGLSPELDGITFPKWRNESIKAYGNAVVPQIVYQIFKAIEQHRLLYG